MGTKRNDAAIDNEAVVRQALDEVWTRGNLDMADALYTASFANHDPNQPEVPPGPAGVKRTVSIWRGIFPDLAVLVDELLQVEDRVLVRFTAKGTHQGDLRGIAATHREVFVSGMVLYRLDDGRITEAWTQWDALGMMDQINATMSDATLFRARL